MDTKSIRYNKNQGFTLVELLITMAITSIVMGAVGVIHSSQQKSYRIQEEIAAMQQNIRAAMYIMEREIRLAGYDPKTSGNFGITDIRYRDKDYALTTDGNSSLEFNADDNLNGSIEATDGNGVLEADGSETISFSLYDPEGDGKLELARRISGVRSAIAENIYSFGLAFAFDNNADGELDTYVDSNGDNTIIWAIDSNNDNWLDLNLDTDNNGDIDENDDTNGNGVIEGQVLTDGKVNISTIRSVRIWLLARADKVDEKILNRGPYVVGDKVIKPLGNDRNYRYELLSTDIKCRNMGI